MQPPFPHPGPSFPIQYLHPLYRSLEAAQGSPSTSSPSPNTTSSISNVHTERIQRPCNAYASHGQDSIPQAGTPLEDKGRKENCVSDILIAQVRWCCGRSRPSQPPPLNPFCHRRSLCILVVVDSPEHASYFSSAHSRRWYRHLLLFAVSLSSAFPRRSSWTCRPDRRVGMSLQSPRATPDSHACVQSKASALSMSGALWVQQVVAGSGACHWLERQHPQHASIPTLQTAAKTKSWHGI